MTEDQDDRDDREDEEDEDDDEDDEDREQSLLLTLSQDETLAFVLRII